MLYLESGDKAYSKFYMGEIKTNIILEDRTEIRLKWEYNSKEVSDDLIALSILSNYCKQRSEVGSCIPFIYIYCSYIPYLRGDKHYPKIGEYAGNSILSNIAPRMTFITDIEAHCEFYNINFTRSEKHQFDKYYIALDTSQYDRHSEHYIGQFQKIRKNGKVTKLNLEIDALRNDIGYLQNKKLVLKDDILGYGTTLVKALEILLNLGVKLSDIDVSFGTVENLFEKNPEIPDEIKEKIRKLPNRFDGFLREEE